MATFREKFAKWSALSANLKLLLDEVQIVALAKSGQKLGTESARKAEGMSRSFRLRHRLASWVDSTTEGD